MSSTMLLNASMAPAAAARLGHHSQTAQAATNLNTCRSIHRCGNPLKSMVVRKSQQRSNRFVVSASSSGGRELYQPFRPPTTVVQDSQAGKKSVDDMLQILRDRDGLWYQYATVIPALSRLGYTPPEIDEATGINGHEQNQLVVGSQVRASLVSTGFDKESILWFDNGGAETLYELRTLSAQQRRAAAEYIMAKNFDPKQARDLAKAMKDFDRRRSVDGWEAFSSTPGDSLALSLLRQTKDARSVNDREALIHSAMEFVETEAARKMLEKALRADDPKTAEEEEVAKATVLVMRLNSEEIPLVLPVCEFSVGSVTSAPSSAAGSSSPFQIHKSGAPWDCFVSVPGWRPIRVASAPVAITVPDTRILPKQVGLKSDNEPILLVVDKGDKISEGRSFFLVDEEGVLNLRAGAEVAGSSYTVLGKVLVALRPPLPEDPSENESWE